MTAAIETQFQQEPLPARAAATEEFTLGNSAEGIQNSRPFRMIEATRLRQIAYSVLDQGFSVGGMFLANIALARTQTKEEYGIFALTYSLFTFLSGLHNAGVLEAYTIYGSGRYHRHFTSFARLLWRSNAWLCLGLTLAVAAVWAALAQFAPRYASRTLLGLALACGVLLTASFLRRTFYTQRRPQLAARFSAVFFFIDVALLWFLLRASSLNGFWAFAIAALAWSAAGIFIAREIPGMSAKENFLHIEPRYWSEHWKYSRWVLVTALVFQFLTQGYYWLAAGILSVKEAGELRALNNLVLPLDQVFTALTLLILPALSLRFASRGLGGLVPLWKSYCLGWLGVSGSFAVSLLLLGRPAMHVLYAGRFDDVAALLPVLAFLPLVMGVGNTMNAALKAMEKPQAVFYAYVASGAATFLIGLPLILRFAVRGAVFGMLASATVYAGSLTIAFLSGMRKERPHQDMQFVCPSLFEDPDR
ncbi:MAG TPA: lipopolysaccharide biosynthesis protein [Candidatus Acidoferrum sp.]|nr:lipopolysaccharide biosynthesis protein [Candidatus Acidoferrum sp.]